MLGGNGSGGNNNRGGGRGGGGGDPPAPLLMSSLGSLRRSSDSSGHSGDSLSGRTRLPLSSPPITIPGTMVVPCGVGPGALGGASAGAVVTELGVVGATGAMSSGPWQLAGSSPLGSSSALKMKGGRATVSQALRLVREDSIGTKLLSPRVALEVSERRKAAMVGDANSRILCSSLTMFQYQPHVNMIIIINII